jgi:hypothetical protein
MKTVSNAHNASAKFHKNLSHNQKGAWAGGQAGRRRHTHTHAHTHTQTHKHTDSIAISQVWYSLNYGDNGKMRAFGICVYYINQHTRHHSRIKHFVKSCVFYNIRLCSLLKANRRFGGTCHLHLQARRFSPRRDVLTTYLFLEMH